MPLSDTAIRQAKPGPKPYRLFDGGGLYLEVAPSGGKWWRLKYRFDGKEKRLSFGVYPDVSLKDAREQREAARKLLAKGIDPGEERKAGKASETGSFAAVAREWIAHKKPTWSMTHAERTETILEKDILPFLGAKQVDKITTPDVLSVLKRIDTRSPVTARKAYSSLRMIFFHAIASGRATTNPADGLTALLSPKRSKRMAAPTDPPEVARLVRTIEGYTGSFIVRCALRLSPLFFLRPGTLRGMEWQDLDFDRAEWRIPIEQMKRRQTEKDARRGEIALIVPLSH